MKAIRRKVIENPYLMTTIEAAIDQKMSAGVQTLYKGDRSIGTVARKHVDSALVHLGPFPLHEWCNLKDREESRKCLSWVLGRGFQFRIPKREMPFDEYLAWITGLCTVSGRSLHGIGMTAALTCGIHFGCIQIQKPENGLFCTAMKIDGKMYAIPNKALQWGLLVRKRIVVEDNHDHLCARLVTKKDDGVLQHREELGK